MTLQAGVSPVELLTFRALLPPKPWLAVALAGELRRTARTIMDQQKILVGFDFGVNEAEAAVTMLQCAPTE